MLKTKGVDLQLTPTIQPMTSRQFNYENKPRQENQVVATRSLLDLATEVLIEIFAYLSAADMIAVQRTCRTIRDIVTGTAYLQYTLHAKINGVDDLLPPDFPYSERLELLRSHEKSWRDLQFNRFVECRSLSGVPQPTSFTLQDSYLIYHCSSDQGRGWQYGYTDLCSAGRNEELHWVHLMMGESQYLSSDELNIVFAVDHDLVVAVRLCVLFAFSSDCKADKRGTAVSNSSMTLTPP